MAMTVAQRKLMLERKKKGAKAGVYGGSARGAVGKNAAAMKQGRLKLMELLKKRKKKG